MFTFRERTKFVNIRNPDLENKHLTMDKSDRDEILFFLNIFTE